jgi:hypothetical protein
VFIARNRFAVLDKASNAIQVRNLQNEVTKKVAPPLPGTDAIFYAGTGLLLCRSEDKVGCPGGVLLHGFRTHPRPSSLGCWQLHNTCAMRGCLKRVNYVGTAL